MRLIVALTCLLAAAVALSLAVGRGSLADPAVRDAILALRGWRCVAAALAGAALAVAGVVCQGLLRNPLASPSVLGATAGAACGGQAALLAYGALAALLPAWLAPELVLPLGCLAGAGLALAVVVALAGPGKSVVTVLLAGVILATLFTSVGACLTALAQDGWQLGRAMVAFTLGGVDGAGPRQAALAAPLVLAGVVAVYSWSRSLDLLLSGEDEAASLGVDVPAARRWLLVWTAALTAAATAIGGGVAFVGLVVPHALRPFTGHEHRRLVPAAAVGGAAFLVLCDVAARLVPTTGDLPLGVVTGLVGAPCFLALLVRLRRSGEVG